MNTPTPAGREPPSFGMGQLLFVVVLVVILVLLGQSMVHHRFFRGGRVTRYGSLTVNPTGFYSVTGEGLVNF